MRGNAPNGEYVEKSLKALTGKTTRDWEHAKDVLREWEEKGKPPSKPGRTTITTWRTEFLALAERNNLSPETIRKYKQLLGQLEEFARKNGLRYVNEFDLQTTTDFRLSWADGPLSASKKLERLRGIMKFAVEREWLIKNPASSLKPPKVKQSPTLPFSKEEMGKIIAAARDNQRVYTFILVMRSTGLRISDVTKLAVDSLKGNRLSLYQAKTGEHVSILLDKSIADALRAVVTLNRNKAYFFWTGESKPTAAVSMWRRRIAEVFTTAGIIHGHTHRFRDTFATELLAKGRSLENVSRLLGHTSIRITERHYSPWVQARQDALDADMEGATDWLTEIEAKAPPNVVQIGGKGR